MPIRLPAGIDNDYTIVVTTDDDEECGWTGRELTHLAVPAATPDGAGSEIAVELPRGFAPGRHRLRVEIASRTADATIIAAPSRIPRPRPPAWGVFAPVYALHDRTASGIGDLGTLERLGQWVAGRGGTVIGTLPMLAMFTGHGKEPCDPSPYAPVSRRFWNELYLDLTSMPEISGPGDLPAPPTARLLDLRGSRRLAARCSKPRRPRCATQPVGVTISSTGSRRVPTRAVRRIPRRGRRQWSRGCCVP